MFQMMFTCNSLIESSFRVANTSVPSVPDIFRREYKNLARRAKTPIAAYRVRQIVNQNGSWREDLFNY